MPGPTRTHLRDLVAPFRSVVHFPCGLCEVGACLLGLGDNCRNDVILQVEAGPRQDILPDQLGSMRLIFPGVCGWFSLDRLSLDIQVDSCVRCRLTESSLGCFGPYWRLPSVQNPPAIAAFVRIPGGCEYPGAPHWDKGPVFVWWRFSSNSLA